MAVTKSKQGQTKKYDGIVKSVQKSQQIPEEPKITREEIQNAFSSFGFPINERGHNDLMYWTTKGKSELPNLIEKLHKKREDINKKEDDDNKEQEQKIKTEEGIRSKQNESKVTLPRLSDEDLNALFDEFGLQKVDGEWARNHLPNDPEKIRSILSLQRKTADDLLKKQSKNAVNAIPEVPKMGATPTVQGPPAPMGGKGGPTPVSMQGEMVQEEPPMTPFFVGDNAIIRITNPNNPNASTTWLVDAKKKVLRPFMSEEAFQNAFESPEEAEKAVITVSSKEFGPGGSLEGFKPLQEGKGVKDDGSMDDIEFSDAQIQRNYGKPIDEAGDNKALSIIDGLLGKIKGAQE
ncbi:MAG TPA: hypothetical protein ENH99_01450 [Candidatus Pacearchaeota archaeon]|nr:hypothetical protein [Candidatus Pacearchaeota archaeon]